MIGNIVKYTDDSRTQRTGRVTQQTTNSVEVTSLTTNKQGKFRSEWVSVGRVRRVQTTTGGGLRRKWRR